MRALIVFLLLTGVTLANPGPEPEPIINLLLNLDALLGNALGLNGVPTDSGQIGGVVSGLAQDLGLIGNIDVLDQFGLMFEKFEEILDAKFIKALARLYANDEISVDQFLEATKDLKGIEAYRFDEIL